MGLTQKIITITQEMINAYRHATLDTNPLHEKCALGFQEEFLLEKLAQQTVPELQNHTGSIVFNTIFHHPIPTNSSVALELLYYDNRELTSCITRNDKIAVAAKFTYHTPSPPSLHEEVERLKTRAEEAHRQLSTPPSTYPITADFAREAAYGIMCDQLAYRALAIGLASAACLTRGKEIILAESAIGNIPVYSRHHLILLPESNHIKDGDQVQISISFIKQDEGKFGATLYAENQDKTPLFAGTLDLAFIPNRVVQRLLR